MSTTVDRRSLMKLGGMTVAALSISLCLALIVLAIRRDRFALRRHGKDGGDRRAKILHHRACR